MTATYVKTNLSYNTLMPEINSIDCRFSYNKVSIGNKGRSGINIINVYYPEGSCKSEQVSWLKNLDASKGSWVVAGDFNVSNILWDGTAPLGQGDHLADTIVDSELIEINDGSFTRIGNMNQRNSAIDITLVSSDISNISSWQTMDDSLQSDHLPILFSFGYVDVICPEIDLTPKFKYSKADWVLFQNLLTDECTVHDPYDNDINSYYDNLCSMILLCADKSIPKHIPGKNGNHSNCTEWWSSECDNACSEKRKALRTFQKDPSITNKQILLAANKKCEEILLSEKSKYWENFCMEEIKDPSDLSKVWKKTKSFQRRYQLPEKPLKVNGKYTVNNFEKASALADIFSQTSQSKYLSEENQNFREKQELSFSDPIPDNSQIFNQDLTLIDLKLAVNSLPAKKKATGKDKISNIMIKHLPPEFQKILLNFFQKCWSEGLIPSSWKEAIVVAIAKPGKPKDSPSSYRPIALTSHVGKLYERIIKLRLEHHLYSNNIIPTCQAGFRKHRNCMEHVVHLVEHAKRALNNGQTTVATFFDIKRAFDTVWHGKLLDKLKNINVSGRMYNFVKVFLENRKIEVKVGESVSASHCVDMGVPQGSVISPILFSIMLHDIESVVKKPGVLLSLFADDLAVWADFSGSKKYNKNWLKMYQDVINSVSFYMKTNGFLLSAEKTNLMVFTRHPTSRKLFFIKLDGHIIKPSITVKFLGVTIHQDLRWQSHNEYLVSKARRGVSLIKCLCGTTWVTPKSLVHLTHALVRARLTYGNEVTFTQTDNQWLVLERIELRALKAALGVSLRAINDLVYQEVGWLPLRNYCKSLTVGFQVRALHSNNNVSTVLSPTFSSNEDRYRKDLAKSHPTIHRITSPISSYTSDVIDYSTLCQTPAYCNDCPLPSWSLKFPQFDFDYADRLVKCNDSILIASLAQERISTYYSNHLKCFTDGSVLDSNEVGCAFVIPKLRVTKSFQLNKGISIFTAELHAIHMACKYIYSLQPVPEQVLLLTDSKSVLQALAKGGSNNRQRQQQQTLGLINSILNKNISLTMMWIPSHSGIRGNNIADSTAKSGAISGLQTDLKLSSKEIIRIARSKIRERRENFMKSRCGSKNWLFLFTPSLA